MAVPAAPTGLAATPGDNQLSVAFVPATGSPTVTGHQYRVGTSGGWKSHSNASPIVIKGLANGKQVTVQIRGVNLDGPGATASVTGTPVDADPTNDNGYADATIFANPGAAVPNLDVNDPDD